ncbi:MAG TPA: hypothetical protein VMU59_01355 [Caulobacteraceae bacterium]|nr:hypothetical protein [Caulobacteraceae bacterium]
MNPKVTACRTVLAALALGLAPPALAFAQSPTSANQPLPCAAQAQSRTGGVMEIVAAAPGQPPGPQLVWQPVATGPGVTLWITYPASALARMDEPNGVLIRFHTPANVNLDTLSVAVKAGNGRAWRFDGKTITAGPNNTGQVAFGLDWPYGRGVISAVAESEPLTVSVEGDDSTLAKESFVLSNIDARDSLLAQTRTRFQALGAAACSTAP